jgi:predicted amidophosphoribosyltransferase
MVCPKCQQENSDTAQFCSRCHMTLRFVCPTCHNIQRHGGTCDKCGLDFMKYAVTLQYEMQAKADKERAKLRTRSSILKQILLLPVTGGFSLLKFFRAMFRGDG